MHLQSQQKLCADHCESSQSTFCSGRDGKAGFVTTTCVGEETASAWSRIDSRLNLPSITHGIRLLVGSRTSPASAAARDADVIQCVGWSGYNAVYHRKRPETARSWEWSRCCFGVITPIVSGLLQELRLLAAVMPLLVIGRLSVMGKSQIKSQTTPPNYKSFCPNLKSNWEVSNLLEVKHTEIHV